MTMYYCQTCGFDSNANPNIGIVLANKAFNIPIEGNFEAFYHGWAYKPKEVSDDVWREKVNQQQKDFFAQRNKHIVSYTHWFCSTKCAIEYLNGDKEIINEDS